MSYYIRLSDSKYPRTLSQVRASNPNKSIPSNATDAQLLPLDHANVVNTVRPVDSNTYVAPDPLPPGYVAPPTYDSDTQYVTEGSPIDSGTQWDQVWDTNIYSQEELNDNLQSSKDAEMLSINTQCNVNILKHWSLEAQSNVSMGIYEQVICEQCKTEISEMLIDCQNNYDAIEVMVLPSAIKAFIPTWSLS